MIRWRWSKGWLPVGYTKKRSREYGKMKNRNIPDDIIQEVLTGLMHQMFQEV
jgi:hypothetical protein